jgi:hypothetical protein
MLTLPSNSHEVIADSREVPLPSRHQRRKDFVLILGSAVSWQFVPFVGFVFIRGSMSGWNDPRIDTKLMKEANFKGEARSTN